MLAPDVAGHAALAAWENFYVIVGSSAAALTGLQFVVIALINDSELRTGGSELATFGTPTIVHFCAVLLVAAGLSAPWPTLWGAAATLATSGLLGVAYIVVTAVRAQRTTRYTPVLEDWIWHVILPFAAYLTLMISGVLLRGVTVVSLFTTGAATMLLLFIGIHNAWDTVTWVALTSAQRARPQPDTAAAAHEAPQSIN